MSKTIIQLPTGNPVETDSTVYYDNTSGVAGKQTTVANLIPAGINNLLFRTLSAPAAGANSLSAQPWFPTLGAVAVAADKSYRFNGTLRLSRSAGTISHTTSLLFGGTATLVNISYRAFVNTGDVVTNLATNQTTIEVATVVVVKAASTSATEQVSISVSGIVRVNAAGTLIPQFQYSAAPGGAPQVLTNSFFELYPIGSRTVVSKGTWS